MEIEKEAPIEIHRVANGFLVRAIPNNYMQTMGNADYYTKNWYVFRTLDQLFAWLSDEHFSSSTKLKS